MAKGQVSEGETKGAQALATSVASLLRASVEIIRFAILAPSVRPLSLRRLSRSCLQRRKNEPQKAQSRPFRRSRQKQFDRSQRFQRRLRRRRKEKKADPVGARKSDIYPEPVTLKISPEMRDSVIALARDLQRAKTTKDERIAANTVIRVADAASDMDIYRFESGDVANNEGVPSACRAKAEGEVAAFQKTRSRFWPARSVASCRFCASGGKASLLIALPISQGNGVLLRGPSGDTVRAIPVTARLRFSISHFMSGDMMNERNLITAAAGFFFDAGKEDP